jgi:PEGA domain-containing protein
MSRPGCLVVAVLVAMSLHAPQAAWADDAPINPVLREAVSHFERGVKLYEELDWRAALIEFERAYSIAPHYAVLYNIGQCRYQLQDYAGALAAFERYLALGGAQGPADVGRRVKATVDDLHGRVARVVVTTDVDDAEITVDDVVVGRTPLASPLVVSEGRRKIGASKTGHAAAARTLDLAGNDSTEVNLRLEPLERAASPVVVARPSRGGHSAAPTITMFGLAAAGIGVGTVFGLLAMEEKNRLDPECPNAGCAPAAQSQIAALKRNAVISTIGFSVGVSGLACGAGYLLLSPGRAEPGSVHPFIGPGVAGAVGSFW